MINESSIIIGFSSEIARAFYYQQREKYPNRLIITFSQRSISPIDNSHIHVQTAYTDSSITQSLKSVEQHLDAIENITIFNGQLHNEKYMPEKRIEELDEAYFRWIFEANTLTPMLWMKHLTNYLSKLKNTCVITCLSARVASINENELGGWYCYRASKAALNMMFKTTAIEFKRRAKTTKLVLFHPGTTDTPLSKPFQKNVPKGKLFSPEFVASKLSEVIETRQIDGNVDYIDWQDKSISW